MLKPICVKCKRFYKPFKNGIFIMEQMPTYNGAPPGGEEETSWIPYKIWRADLYKCKGCGEEIVCGYGFGPVSEHYMDNFKEHLALVIVTVNDC